MNWIYGAVIAILIGLAGFMAGTTSGVEKGKSEVANECRKAGAFTVKRTGFSCGVMEK